MEVISMGSRKLLITGMIALTLSGCAASRSTFDLSVTQTEHSDVKAYVKLLQVADQRRYEVNPRDPSIPSLGNAAQIDDRAITSRAVARKRNSWGMALSDILLPEGRTVEQVVREAVTKALADKGYAVVEPGDGHYATALPLNVDIQKFWSWMTPGFFSISLEFEGTISMQSDAILDLKQEMVRGYSHGNFFAATDGAWHETMQEGMADLITKISAKLRKPEDLHR
jgi:hypothetical protein